MSDSTKSVPTKWRLTTIGAVCSKPQYGWTTSAADSGEVKLLRTTDITRGPVDWNTVPFCRNVPPDVEKYLLAEGDIVVSRAGSVGVSCRVVAPERSVFASYLIRFRPKEEIDGKYLTYVLQSPAYWSQVRGSTSGIAVPNVNASKLEAFEIPLAPLPEQHRIVAEIEKQFTRLDAGVAALRRLQANLKRYRAAVLKAACEGRLVPTEAELARKEGRTFETGEQLLQRILVDRLKKHFGKKYSEPSDPATAHFPALPKGWCFASLEALTSASRPICYGILMPKENVADGVLYVKVRNMRGDKIDLDGLQRTTREIAAAYARASLKTGDLLLSIRGTYGRVAEVPKELDGGNITQDTARLDVSERVDHRYVATCLRSPDNQNYFKRVARGVAVKGVNIGDVRPTPIALPPLAEQRRIIAEVERRLSVVQELETVVNANLQRATRLRQSILQQAFSAKDLAQ